MLSRIKKILERFKGGIEMNFVYKKIEKQDKEQLLKLIDIVLGSLENPEYFIPYEPWEIESMFDEKNYAPLYGAYDKDKLVRNGAIICFARYACRL